jgi:hypothetical protein
MSAKPAITRITAEKVFESVWRFDFHAPGFAVLDLNAEIDSHTPG